MRKRCRQREAALTGWVYCDSSCPVPVAYCEKTRGSICCSPPACRPHQLILLTVLPQEGSGKLVLWSRQPKPYLVHGRHCTVNHMPGCRCCCILPYVLHQPCLHALCGLCTLPICISCRPRLDSSAPAGTCGPLTMYLHKLCISGH